MSKINPLGLKAYLQTQELFEEKSKKTSSEGDSFTATLKDSLKKVNDLQEEKESMIKAFAAGEKQNVHELMITLQKAGIAMQMTTAVRNKVLEAYKEIMHLTF
ncbi:MAG: flagellar hook-basal body complex protein FliE [Desulfonauticus sp.]|jgi:flagellar hook-basal body complex protein FliE|nr:MAG: Flagellar hook-basal body complex protein FliE [Desulfonauticus sp. 38_4375]MDK2922322.1 flagellar hook-basal body complex protein FliE [Desulfonauticus sp.]